MDSARGVAAIVVCRRNSSCNSSCDAIVCAMVEELLHSFCCFECNSLSAIGCVTGCSKHVSSVVAAAKYWNLTPCRFHPLPISPFSKHPNTHVNQEDVNGEKLTVKKWWISGADFFTVWCRFFHGLRRLFTAYKGHKR